MRVAVLNSAFFYWGLKMYNWNFLGIFDFVVVYIMEFKDFIIVIDGVWMYVGDLEWLVKKILVLLFVDCEVLLKFGVECESGELFV